MAYIPHFYYNFYVFQYATGFISAVALAEKVLSEGDVARDRYLELLRSGGSDYPLALLRKAGVDLGTSEPYDVAMRVFNDAIDSVEQLPPVKK